MNKVKFNKINHTKNKIGASKDSSQSEQRKLCDPDPPFPHLWGGGNTCVAGPPPPGRLERGETCAQPPR